MLKLVWGKMLTHSSCRYARVKRAVEIGERGAILCAALAVLTIFSTRTLAGDPVTYAPIPFDIPQQRADIALTKFAEQADLTLFFPFDKVRDKTANRLVGAFTLEEAIEVLLEGTGLTSTFSNRVVLNIAPDTAEAPKGEIMSARKSSGIGALLAAVFSVGAVAQDQATSGEAVALEEIVVTSQRREQSLRDVPISVTAFTEQMLRDNMIVDLAGYFNKTPNVSFMTGGSRSARSISIRGVSDIGGLTSSFAVYVDEFNIANGPTRANDNNTNSSLNPQLQDIERIEILRGPQGTFFGRNATGGAINIITKKPAPEFYAEGTMEYGRFNTWNVGGVVNGTVVEDKLFMRGSAYYSESDGFVVNTNPAGGTSDYDFNNFRLAARWLATDRLTVDVSVNSTTENQGLDSSVPSGVLEDSSVGLAGSLGLAIPALAGQGAYPENITRVNHNTPLKQRNEFLVATGRLEYAADNFTITSVTGYLDSQHTSTIDLDLTGDDYFNQDADITSDTISQELRIQSVGNGNLDWVVGGLYAEDNLTQNFLARVGAGGLFFGLPENLPLADGVIVTDRTSYALFGELTWHATERLGLTIGARYSNDEIERVENRLSFFTQLPEAAGTESWDDVSPKFAVTYAATDDVNVYGTISKGYKSGGLQTNIESPSFAVTTYDEETLWNYEVGVKADLLDRRLFLGAALFYMDWTDMQVLSGLTLLDPDTGLPIFLLSTDNAASASSSGFELEFRALLGDRFQVGGGVGYLNAEFDKFPDALIFGQSYDLSGTRLPRAPKWTINADAQYDFPLSNNRQAFIRAEANYRSETIPIFDSTVKDGFPWRTPDFSVWNLRAGVTSERYQVTGYVENVFDEQYFTGIDPTFGFAGVMIRPAQRTYGVRLVVSTN